MEYVFLLSKDNLSLAKAEVLSLISAKKHYLKENILVAETDINAIHLANRLAYSNSIYRVLFKAKQEGLLKNLEGFGWNSIYKKDFSLRITNLAENEFVYDEAYLADFIWKKVKKPKVNLENSKTPIVLIITKNEIYCCLKFVDVKKGFEFRRAHLRPKMLPISMHPKLARAMVNLTGIMEGTLVDPFCGTAGILIEAGLMGLKAKGYDIDANMVKYAKTNLGYYKIKNKTIMAGDSTKIREKWDYVATDLPYAINTKKQNLEVLYSNFLKNLRRNLRKKAVLGFPHFINYKKLIKKNKLNLENEFNLYIHKSLTKKIAVVSP